MLCVSCQRQNILKKFLRYLSTSEKYSWKLTKLIEHANSWEKPPPCPWPVKREKKEGTSKLRKAFPHNMPPKRSLPVPLDQVYRVPDTSHLPFDFMYSYTETPNVAPLGFREPPFSPFGPSRLDREWNGVCAPAKRSENCVVQPSRDEVLGIPLTEGEIGILVDRCLPDATRREVFLGEDGLTHNDLIKIHRQWRMHPTVRVICTGLPSIDMKNICFHLEDKTGGKIIYELGNLLVLFRGRYYRPITVPKMLWRPHPPIYPSFLKKTIDGLSVGEIKILIEKGMKMPALVELSKKGIYCELVQMVQMAFRKDEVVRIDSKGLTRSDYEKVGTKLQDLVPCIFLALKCRQMLFWRGKIFCFEGEKASND